MYRAYLCLIYFLIILVLCASCKTYKPIKSYAKDQNAQPIDYSSLSNWAAHPLKKDLSDESPDGLPLPQGPMEIDVFFVHPTSFTGSKGEDTWNAPIDNEHVNKKTDEGAIKYQASVFNQVGQVYAPRYRQAHIEVYYTKDWNSARQALDFAYHDVKTAFQYFLENYSKGKPFIIAAHSQGTNHAERLINDMIDKTNLKNRMVAAYLIGMPIANHAFENIPPCHDADQTGCFVSWRTFKKGYVPEYTLLETDIAVSNPLSWKTDTIYVGKDKNQGTILKNFKKVHKALVDAQVYENILWANKPSFFGSIFLTTKNYHVADYNFYYMSIRENAKHRVGLFWKR
jgi:hypothetical protein